MNAAIRKYNRNKLAAAIYLTAEQEAIEYRRNPERIARLKRNGIILRTNDPKRNYAVLLENGSII